MASPYANWSVNAYYNVGDIVQYNGAFFQALVANIGVTPVAGLTWATFIPPSQLPAGIFNGNWALGTSGYYQSTLTGVSPLLTSTSSLSCTLQTNSNTNLVVVDQELHWLITCIPSSANGGSITFIISAPSAPSLPANFFVSWAVTKF